VPGQISETAVLPQFLEFFRTYRLRLAAVSAFLLAPCFWHREIASSDLGSHLYNAWLAQLIRRGEVPGLWIAPQHTNVLFDYMLGFFGSFLGWHIAEKIAVSISVLIFFWGTFAFVTSATRRAPWLLAPAIALFTYGWTFHLGLFNYYLSLGLAFSALAIFWRGQKREWLAAAVFAVLSVVAHPLGFVWLAAAGAYVLIAETASKSLYRLLLLLAAAALIFVLRFYLFRHYDVYAGAGPAYVYSGVDQLLLFGPRYQIPEFGLAAFCVVSIAFDLIRRRRESNLWLAYSISLQLYVLVELGVQLLPGGIHFPPPTATLALLTERLTSVSAVLLCCLLGAMQPRKWHLAVTGAIAAIFFAFVYQDTAKVNRMEQQVVRLVSQLPPNQRVMGTIEKPDDSRVLLQHILDRACIGRCFSYGNYEPSTGLFRVRASPGNPYVLSSYDDAVDMENGEYVVQPEDLPVYQVYQCGPAGSELCIRSLQAGEENDRLGVHPDD
jgi:hypothetical protein